MATGGMFHRISGDKAREFIRGLLRVRGDPVPWYSEDASGDDDTDSEEAEEEEETREWEDRETKQNEFEEIFVDLCALVKGGISHIGNLQPCFRLDGHFVHRPPKVWIQFFGDLCIS